MNVPPNKCQHQVWLEHNLPLMTKNQDSEFSDSLYKVVSVFKNFVEAECSITEKVGIAKQIDLLADKKIEYYKRTNFGNIRKFFSSIVNYILSGFKTEYFKTSAEIGKEIAQRIIKEHEPIVDRIVKSDVETSKRSASESPTVFEEESLNEFEEETEGTFHDLLSEEEFDRLPLVEDNSLFEEISNEEEEFFDAESGELEEAESPPSQKEELQSLGSNESLEQLQNMEVEQKTLENGMSSELLNTIMFEIIKNSWVGKTNLTDTGEWIAAIWTAVFRGAELRKFVPITATDSSFNFQMELAREVNGSYGQAKIHLSKELQVNLSSEALTTTNLWGKNITKFMHAIAIEKGQISVKLNLKELSSVLPNNEVEIFIDQIDILETQDAQPSVSLQLRGLPFGTQTIVNNMNKFSFQEALGLWNSVLWHSSLKEPA